MGRSQRVIDKDITEPYKLQEEPGLGNAIALIMI
jgi:hypothetical protein